MKSMDEPLGVKLIVLPFDDMAPYGMAPYAMDLHDMDPYGDV